MTFTVPSTIELELLDDVAVLRLCRPRKRNALDDETVRGMASFFTDLPDGVRAVVLDAEGDHFCAGLDLSELTERSVFEGLEHSRMWHRAFERIESGRVPVVSVLKGAVIGGGLELACATHLRVAEDTAWYALPEGQHGIFVGGGASVRLPQLIGLHRMADMMLTGRVYDADQGQHVGISQYRAATGAGFEQALDLARTMAALSPITTFAVLQALPRIAQAHPADGALMESMMSAIAQGSPEAKERMGAFLAGRRSPARPAGDSAGDSAGGAA
jgi:(methylthio)acryloyl-CoA hydratase